MREERSIAQTPLARVPFRRLSWSAIFGGTFFALGIMLILSLFGLAIGAAAAGPSRRRCRWARRFPCVTCAWPRPRPRAGERRAYRPARRRRARAMVPRTRAPSRRRAGRNGRSGSFGTPGAGERARAASSRPAQVCGEREATPRRRRAHVRRGTLIGPASRGAVVTIRAGHWVRRLAGMATVATGGGIRLTRGSPSHRASRRRAD